ncbi:MAG: pyridoxal phosphate-dependent aminotransferase [Deltaproteobacteria bacterium]|nr:pyridoxal phosphate-dependent aminotransferase [Deltaproteobacteria bacterium]
MKLEVSSRLEKVYQSEIRNMSIECLNAGGINLAQGVCDLSVPDEVIGGAHNAMLSGINIYTRYEGLEELRTAIAHKILQDHSIPVDPEEEIIVSAGATGAFYCACMALLNPGDEIIVFEPFYGYHINTLKAVGASPVYCSLNPPEWTFRLEDLERLITTHTKGILINTPANPSGKVFSAQEVGLLADFACRHDLFVFTDEIYEHFIYSDEPHIMAASLPGMRERTITISGFSKVFSITGWRIGYCICDKRWSKAIGYFNDLIYVCAPAPLQIGAAKGLIELGPDYYEDIRRSYRMKRDKVCSALSSSGMKPYVPDGAYDILADISSVPGADSKEKAMHILKKTGVACVPGKAFFNNNAGEDLARFCFAKHDDVLDEACERLSGLT